MESEISEAWFPTRKWWGYGMFRPNLTEAQNGQHSRKKRLTIYQVHMDRAIQQAEITFRTQQLFRNSQAHTFRNQTGYSGTCRYSVKVCTV